MLIPFWRGCGFENCTFLKIPLLPTLIWLRRGVVFFIWGFGSFRLKKNRPPKIRSFIYVNFSFLIVKPQYLNCEL